MASRNDSYSLSTVTGLSAISGTDISTELATAALPPARTSAASIHSLNLAVEDVSSEVQSSRRLRQQILVVISSVLLTFTGCGLNFAFGVYQELYETLDGPFSGASSAQIDLIGTLAVSLMTMGAPFASAWTKAYSPRSVTLFGAVLFAVANIAASFGQSLWHFVLTQGLLLGCATCFSYIPAVTIAPGWFDGRRGLAMGIILSGTGLGGVAWAPLLRYMNASIGFRNTLRATGVIAFVLIAPSAWILKWDPVTLARHQLERSAVQSTASSRHRAFDLPRANWGIVKTRAFVAHASGAILQAAAYYTPVYFLSSYARTLGYSAVAGANFIALSNASNFGGKIVLGWVADRYGRLNALVFTTLLSAVVTLGLWLPSTELLASESTRRSLFVAFSCLYGFSASAYVSLFPTALAEQFGIQNFASINGLLYMVRGFGTLVGTPTAGALIRDHSMGLDGLVETQGFGGTAGMVGALLVGATVAVAWARLENGAQQGWKWRA